MESFELALTDSGFHISGFPDATKVIKLSGHKRSGSGNLNRGISGIAA